MAVRAKDIARELGISEATVSLVLRQRPGISEATRARVLEAARRMGYEPVHRTVRPSIRLVQYKRHGAVVADTDFFARLIESIDRQAKRLGYDLLISYFYGNQDPREQLRLVQEGSCAGVLLLATEMYPADLEPFRGLHVPLVVLDNYFPDDPFDCILINNAHGAKRAVQYLVACGHTEIGHLASNVTIRNFYERQDGWLRAVKAIPVANDCRRHVVKVAPTAEGAFRDMTAYLAGAPKLPTAFFADNDLIALACMRALHMAGYRIPEDVSIIGLDGIAAGKLSDPPLTTMNVPKEQLSIAAVNRLDERIHGLATGIVKIQVTTELCERASVARLD